MGTTLSTSYESVKKYNLKEEDYENVSI